MRWTWDTVAQRYNCVFDPAVPTCELFDERRIIPLVADEARVYWLEVRRSAQGVIDADTPATHLVRYYDYEPLSGAVSASFKTRVAPTANKPRALLRGPQLR